MHSHTDDELVFARRFREAMHTAGLSHLNIATLFDYGEDDGLAYLVMELVRGVTLQQLLDREGAMPPSRVRSVIGQAALALSVAHSAGIVHRDVKPANIMVTKDGTVKPPTGTPQRRSRHAGEMLGTPHM
jgi:serine/threonine-protein kinase